MRSLCKMGERGGAMRTVRIGAGAGFADDRIEPARDLVERGDLDYLVFDCLAERTIALAQRDRRANPEAGYNEWLEARMDAVLEPAARRGTACLRSRRRGGTHLWVICVPPRLADTVTDCGVPRGAGRSGAADGTTRA
jgi:Acyclic terpene utilisation family protein AtuA